MTKTSVSEIKHSELDFFKCKLLGDKVAVRYVRNGDMFFYIGNEKLILDKEDNFANKEERFTVGDTEIRSVKMDLTKDSRVPGKMWFWQDDGYYGLSFIDDTALLPPIVLKIGDVNKEL